MQALNEFEKAVVQHEEQERRRVLAVDLLDALETALEGKGSVPADTIRHMLFAVESLLVKVRDE